METTYKYKAFISYSHQDQKFAKWLHKKIENYKIPKSLREKYPNLPKDLKRTIFLDDEELPTASALPDNLSHALESSELLIVICSPSATQSYWVDKEIVYFKQFHGAEKVLAILKEGEPNTSYSTVYDNEVEAFPKALRYKLNENGELTEERTEPLAADARDRKNRKKALIKLIAGILKVDFADLWQREQKERTKRRIIIGLILTLFIALSIYASVQFLGEQGNKELEHINTKISTIEYSIRHDELPVEKVIALNKELKKLKKDKENKEASQKALGKLKTSLGKKAERVYQKEGAKPAIEILTSQASLANQESRLKDISKEKLALAKLYVETYEFEKAEENYKRATEIFFDYENVLAYGNFLQKQNKYKKSFSVYERLLDQNISLIKKAGILNNKAIILTETNEFKEAEQSYLDALSIYNKLEKNMPGTYTEEFSNLYDELGLLYIKMGQVKAAEESFNTAISLSRFLIKINEKKYKPNLSLFLNNLGGFYLETNNYEAAKEILLESLNIYRDINLTDPYMGLALNNLGLIYAKENYIIQSEASYIEALKMYRELDKYNPREYSYYVAMVLNNLGSLYHKIHQFKKSEEVFIECITRRKVLAELNPDVYALDAPHTLYNLALLYGDMGEAEKSKDAYLEALVLYKTFTKDYPNNDTYKYYVGRTLNNLTNIYISQHQINEAKNYYMKTLKIRKILAKTKPGIYSFDYASTIIMGVDLFGQPLKNLDSAENILHQFNDNPKSKILLNIIDNLRK